MQQFQINKRHRKFPAHIQKIKFPSNARLSYIDETTIKLGDMSQVPMSESMMNYLDIMKSCSGLMGCHQVHTTGLRTIWFQVTDAY